MRRAAVLIVLALVACGRQEPGGTAAKTEASGVPSIGPTAAPGVAFAYGYSFRFADERIRGVQEAHASACEKLGLARCRITGLRYAVADAGRIDGMLSFALDPAIARAFGNNAISVVEQDEGTLADAQITGTDAGSAVAQADGEAQGARGEIAALEKRVRTATGGERDRLLRHIDELRAQLSASTTAKADARATLAATPMTFTYRSGSLVGGLDLRDAVSTASSSFNAMVWFIIVALGALLPWAALAALVWMTLRTTRQALQRRRLSGDQTQGVNTD